MSSVLILVTDERGFKLAEISAAAALETQRNIDAVVVFTVGFFVPDTHPLKREAEKRGIRFDFRLLEMDNSLAALYPQHGKHKHVTSASAMKFPAIYRLKEEFDLALYIDNDVLLMSDFNISLVDFELHPIAAVYDIAKTGGLAGDEDFFANCLASQRSHHYFNSGVIVANLKSLDEALLREYYNNKRAHSSRRCDYHRQCSCNDQCAWNMTFEKNWKRLPLTFNLQACAMFQDEWTFATARHYVGPQKFFPMKPWRNDARDTALLNAAFATLGISWAKRPLAFFTRSINEIRHHRTRQYIGESLNRVSELFCQEM